MTAWIATVKTNLNDSSVDELVFEYETDDAEEACMYITEQIEDTEYVLWDIARYNRGLK